MSVKILRPVAGVSVTAVGSKTSYGTFVASGRASSDICGITWNCQLIADPNVTGCGTWLSFHPHKLTPHGNMRWSMTIRVPRDGDYRLTVFGHRVGHVPDTAVADFPVRIVRGGRGVSITWPNITALKDFANDFCPYGSISGDTISKVSLYNRARAIDSYPPYQDPVELEFWTAQFDTIPAEIFTLRLDLAGGGFEEAPNLDFR